MSRWKALTARQRLTIAITLIPVGTAVVMGAAVYLFMRFVPSYQLPGSASVSTAQVDVGSPIASVSPGTEGVITINSSMTIRSEVDVLSAVLWISVITAVVLGLAGLLIGHILARRMLRPLHQFNDAATRAADGGLDHRVGLTGPRDEFTDLSDTFDRMLERLDRTFQSHQRFTADASHELKTPLSAMKTMLDVAARDPDTDLATLLTRLQQTNQRSIDTVEALLDLADLDHTVIDREPVDLGFLVREVIAGSAQEATHNTVVVATDIKGVSVYGNAILLRQLATNLIQNAIRHNHAGGTMDVRISTEGEFTVSNSGAQVDSLAVAAFTTPFYRGSGRAAAAGPRSSGLGLAVVAAIASAHGATLSLSANSPPSGGLTVKVRFQIVK